MKTSLILSLLSLFATTLSAPTPQDAPSADEAPFRLALADIRIQGDNCPPDTPVTADIQRDTINIRLDPTQFSATTIGWNKREQNCQVLVRMDNPEGWQFTVSGIHHVGEFALQEGITARQRYVFSGGQSGSTNSEISVRGPTVGGFNTRRGVRQSWSRCGARGILDVWAGMRVDMEQNGGFGWIQYPQGAVQFQVSLGWRQCNPNDDWNGNNGGGWNQGRPQGWWN